jgi:hypothetical protein
MKNINRYEELKNMLDNDNIIINIFVEGEEEYFMFGTYVQNYYFTVNQQIDKLELIIEKYDSIEEEYYIIEKRYYKTAKGAYNKIVDLIRE